MSLLNRNEIRRLEKAAREKDKTKLAEWAGQFETQISESYRLEYEKQYQDEIQSSINNFLIALAYTLYFSEELLIDKTRLPNFIEDLMVTVDMYRTGESKPIDYLDQLKEAGVIFDKEDCNYNEIFNKRIERLEEMSRDYHKKLKELGINVFDYDEKGDIKN